MTAKTPTSNDAAVGARIMALRKAKGMSRADLSRAIGITSSQIQKYEMALTRVGGRRLQMIAHALTVPISALFDDEGNIDQSETLIGLHDSDAGDLLRFYNGIKDPQLRRHVVTIVQTAARFRVRPGKSNQKPREP